MKNKLKQLKSDQNGQVLVWVAIMLPLLIALVGLVFDGGLMWAKYRRARWAADGAAVAAASEIDVQVFVQEGRVVLTEHAMNTATWFARQNDPGLHLSNVYVQGNVIHVQGSIEVEPVFLSLFGIGNMQLRVQGRERPAWGISQQGQ